MKIIRSNWPLFLGFGVLIVASLLVLKYTDLFHEKMISPYFSLILALMAFAALIKIRHAVLKLSKKKKKREAVITFSINLAFGVAVYILTIPILSEFGVPTASLITILGTSSLAVGLALKSFLANIAAGIMVIFQKPFDIGELVEISGKVGKVDKIDLFSVRLKTANNELVYVPNGKLVSDKIINKTQLGKRRLDITLGVSYESDLKKAKMLAQQLIEADERILKDPAPIVAVDNLGDSAIDITVRLWLENAHYAAVKWDFLENIKTSFDDNGIIIPYPQMNVWLNKNEQ